MAITIIYNDLDANNSLKTAGSIFASNKGSNNIIVNIEKETTYFYKAHIFEKEYCKVFLSSVPLYTLKYTKTIPKKYLYQFVSYTRKQHS